MGITPSKAVAKVKKTKKLSWFLPKYTVDLFPFFHQMAALCVQYEGEFRPNTKKTRGNAAHDLLFVFVGCTYLLPTRKYVRLLDPTRITFEQVCSKLPNYFIFIFMSLFHMLMVQCYTSLLIAKYVPTNISLVAIDNASIHQHIIQTFISFARV
jgi:hypothetical protein